MNFNFIDFFPASVPQKIVGIGLLLALSSCGGSSSTTVPATDLPSPVANEIKDDALVAAPAGQEPAPAAELESLPVIAVSQRHFADPNVLLNLQGSVTAAPGAKIVKTLWTQVTGPQVRIPSPLQLSNEIVIPDVNIATTLEFRLTAQDSNNKVNSATVSILVKPVPSFIKVIGGVVNESDREAIFTLRLNAASDLPVTVAYITQNGTATSGSDYVFSQGEVTLAAGEVSKSISVPLIDDALSESDESFKLQVTTLDSQITHANSGIVIIHNGVESLLPQTISFINPAAASIPLGLQYANPLAAGPGSGAVLYSSSNQQVATVDANGLATPLAQGTTTITAIKAGDATYQAAEISYPLQVTNSTFAPEVTIARAQGVEGISLQMGETLFLEGSATDREDGVILYSAPGREVVWTSNIDGILSYNAPQFSHTGLAQGAHIISLSVTDSDGNLGSASIPVYSGNLAALATVSGAETSNCDPATIALRAINDSNLSTSLTPICGAEAVITLTWQSNVTINRVDLYTDSAMPMHNYNIDYFYSPRETWISLIEASSLPRTLHSFPITPITTRQLRISQGQPGIIKELVVYGLVAGSSVQTPTTPNSSSASSSTSSTAIVNSSTASFSSSSSAKASSIASSVPASSLASSAKASSVASSAKASSVASSSKGVVVL